MLKACEVVSALFSCVSSPFMRTESCDIRQQMNQKLTTGVPELHQLKVHSPWYYLGINFVGSLLTGCDGAYTSSQSVTT